MPRSFHPTSGTRHADAARVVFALLLLLAGCNYTFQAGAGLPAHVQTLAIIPFENTTSRFELSQELHEVLLSELPRTLGVRTGGEEFAEAVVRGTVVRYSVEAPIYRPNETGNLAEVLERQVMLTVNVQIVDTVNNVILWESPSLAARGEFLEGAQQEADGRRLAITRMAQAIIDGLQSNW
ncbi:MAG: hypothetical protein EXR92_06655 [Gemmatimonadetes bacterium]|nr:hypothetical protein [Gemmatimonadota bacterium]